MKNLKTILSFGLTVVLITGCGRSEGGRKEDRSSISEKESPTFKDYPKADSMASNGNGFISSSAAVVNKDTSKKFIRTADLKFKVKDVKSATFKIEDIISVFDGFVTYTNLSSTINRRTLIPVTKDSSSENTYYTVENNIVIRVPNIKLDTSLKAIAKLMDYLDYRIIKADDVTLSLLTNKAAEKRLNAHEQRLTKAIDNRGKKLYETSDVEENLLNKQMLSDKARIANMSLKDQISFSTIHLTIYQRETIKIEKIENDKSIECYKPDFLNRIMDSLKIGWAVLEYIIVFFAAVWEFILLGLIAFFMYKRFFYKKNKI